MKIKHQLDFPDNLNYYNIFLTNQLIAEAIFTAIGYSIAGFDCLCLRKCNKSRMKTNKGHVTTNKSHLTNNKSLVTTNKSHLTTNKSHLTTTLRCMTNYTTCLHVLERMGISICEIHTLHYLHM